MPEKAAKQTCVSENDLLFRPKATTTQEVQSEDPIVLQKLYRAKRTGQGSCYLYHADLDFYAEIMPVSGHYNIPLGKCPESISLKQEIELVVSSATESGKDAAIIYVNDEIVSMVFGK